jgi:hypothetical protein
VCDDDRVDDIRMTHALDDVIDVFADFGGWWAIGGGWAIDLHVGERGRRPHKDVDLVCLQPEAGRLRDHLAGWDLHRVVDGRLEPWIGALAPAHQIWVRPSPDDEWAFEVLFEAVEDDEWRYRRNPRVTLPVGSLRTTVDEIPTVHLGVALLYKAKRDDDQDRDDLRACLGALGAGGRAWLGDAVRSTHGPLHRWLRSLG